MDRALLAENGGTVNLPQWGIRWWPNLLSLCSLGVKPERFTQWHRGGAKAWEKREEGLTLRLALKIMLIHFLLSQLFLPFPFSTILCGHCRGFLRYFHGVWAKCRPEETAQSVFDTGAGGNNRTRSSKAAKPSCPPLGPRSDCWANERPGKELGAHSCQQGLGLP